jgi:lysophospholipase
LLDHENKIPLRGAVVSAPFLEVGMRVPAVKRAAAKIGNIIAPKLRFPTGIDAKHVSRDPERRSSYVDDPRRVDSVTPRWAHALDLAQARVAAEVSRIELPMLWYAGTADQLVNTETTTRIYESSVRNRGSDRTLELLEGFYHEPHNEPLEDRQRVFAMIRSWMSERLSDSA